MRNQNLFIILLLFGILAGAANATTYYQHHNMSLAGSGLDASLMGEEITMAGTYNLTGIGRQPGETATTCYVKDSTGTITYATAAFAGDNCSVSIVLNASQRYWILTDSGGGVRTYRQTLGCGAACTNITDSLLNWTAGIYAGTRYPTAIYAITDLTFDSLPSPPGNLSVALNAPANGTSQANKTFAVQYTAATLGPAYSCDINLDGAMANRQYFAAGATGYANITTTYGWHAINATCNTTTETANSSTSYVKAALAVAANSPADGADLSGTLVQLNYSTTNYYPITCNLSIDGVVNDTYAAATSSSRVANLTTNGTHTWNVTCYGNDNLTYSETFSRTVSLNAAVFTNILNLTSSFQNVLASPQALFYDIGGNLNALYFETTPNRIHIHKVIGTSVNQSWEQQLNATKQFWAVFREPSYTRLLTFWNDNLTKSFIDINGGMNITNSTAGYNVLPNGLYDPYNYAYTKQFQNLMLGNGSYYIFMLPTTSNSTLVRMNASGNTLTSLNWTVPKVGWQTVANDSALSTWYHLAPRWDTVGYQVDLRYYNGTNDVFIDIVDNNSHTQADMERMLGIFEAYGDRTYVMLTNSSLNQTIIYLIGLNQSVLLNYSITNPSHFLFTKEDTFVFFSNGGGNLFAYSCYFGNTTSCIRFPYSQYGAYVPYDRGPMTTAKRSGNSDIITRGQITSGSVVQLAYNQNTYDVKYICYNETVPNVRLPFTVSVFSNTTASILSNLSYGYVIPSAVLGGGNQSVFFLCQNGVERELFSGISGGYALNFYSLNSGLGNYYTFTVRDAYGQLVPGVLVSAYRFEAFQNTSVAIAQGISDFSGTVVLYLQPFAPYTLVVTSSNYATISSAYTPSTNTNPVITLGSTGAQFVAMPDWNYEYNDISWSVSPKNLTIYNATNISFQISAAHSDLLLFGMNVSLMNYSTLTHVCNQTVTTSPSGGILNCSLTSFGNYQIEVFWQVENYSFRDPAVYILYSNGTMYQSAFDTFATNQPIGPWGFYAIALILAMLAGGWVARYTVDGAGLVVCAVLWFFTLFNPGACLAMITQGVCITPVIATTFTTFATVAALFLVRYL